MRPRKATEDDILDALREAEDPVLDQKDIAERVGVTERTMRNYREELEASDRIETKKVSNTIVYYPADRRPSSRDSDRPPAAIAR